MDEIDVDAIMEDIERRVAVRRAEGAYPLGLEEQLEAEFKYVMAGVHRREVDSSALRHHVDGASRALAGVGATTENSSRLPGGAVVHGATARLISRHIGALAEQTRTFGEQTLEALREVAVLADAQRSADERQLKDVVASLLDRMAVLDHLGAAVLELERRVAELEAATPGRA